LFPVGRLVQGDPYKARDKDMQGRPLTTKTGKNTGAARVEYPLAVAIPKTPGVTHWGLEAWGVPILAYGRASWPQGQAEKTSFAWKIVDGDSTELNEGTPPRRWCDIEGFPGNWVVKFKSGFAPKIVDVEGNAILQEGVVKCGHYVEVLGTIDTNENPQKPGLYINHSYIAYRGFGQEITSGPDPKSIGFGKSALPAGASPVPVGASALPSQVPAAAGSPPPPPAAGSPPPPPAASSPPPPAPAPTALAPSPTFLAPPPPGALPGAAAPPPPPAAAAPPPPVPSGPVMTAKANGATYASFIASGWNEAQMRASGYLQ
jgi:hypothetical protein